MMLCVMPGTWIDFLVTLVLVQYIWILQQFTQSCSVVGKKRKCNLIFGRIK